MKSAIILIQDKISNNFGNIRNLIFDKKKPKEFTISASPEKFLSPIESMIRCALNWMGTDGDNSEADFKIVCNNNTDKLTITGNIEHALETLHTLTIIGKDSYKNAENALKLMQSLTKPKKELTEFTKELTKPKKEPTKLTENVMKGLNRCGSFSNLVNKENDDRLIVDVPKLVSV